MGILKNSENFEKKNLKIQQNSETILKVFLVQPVFEQNHDDDSETTNPALCANKRSARRQNKTKETKVRVQRMHTKRERETERDKDGKP